ncbi:MAG: hypothetical protein WA142_11115 [Rugosibacter sp.]|jgi:hypothetical protein
MTFLKRNMMNLIVINSDKFGLRFFQGFVLAIMLVLITGCAGVNNAERQSTSQSVSNASQPIRSVQALLIYFEQLRQLSAVDLTKEIERARKNYQRGKSVFYQLQYAMALSFPEGDARHAQQLLEPIVKDNLQVSRPVHALAVLLHTNIVERLRLELLNQSQANALQMQTLRADEFKNKLDALREIERKMLQRDSVVKP